MEVRGALEDTLTPSLFLPREQRDSLTRSTGTEVSRTSKCLCTSPARHPQPKSLLGTHRGLDPHTQCRVPLHPSDPPPKRRCSPGFSSPLAALSFPIPRRRRQGAIRITCLTQSDGCWCILSFTSQVLLMGAAFPSVTISEIKAIISGWE